MLSQEELERYERQIMIYGFGEEGQEKLKQATVFIGGCGGLGSPVAIYLAAAGIGTIRIADHDKVELSNLNRQVLHWEENIGGIKVDSAATKLKKLNPEVNIETSTETITVDNISQLTADCDAIVDATDNLPARYLLNKTAVEKGKPFFHGAVYGLEGRAMTIIPGKSACLNCLYHNTTLPKE
ncbi:MAG: adenylyltransferase, partial [Gammaproteobacteria bacterium]|nr:adenylyltransferase [Gammaproteobacteria bacterium]NIO63155.1 adenylyltransferase [Gammaproteobacteria bacterium]